MSVLEQFEDASTASPFEVHIADEVARRQLVTDLMYATFELMPPAFDAARMPPPFPGPAPSAP